MKKIDYAVFIKQTEDKEWVKGIKGLCTTCGHPDKIHTPQNYVCMLDCDCVYYIEGVTVTNGIIEPQSIPLTNIVFLELFKQMVAEE